MSTPGKTRNTRQRTIVYGTLKNANDHPTAEMLLDTVRKTLPTISLGTVYRNLNVLKDQGLIIEVHGADRTTHFDADLTPHAHFTCRRCGAISDLHDCPAPDWQRHSCLDAYTIETATIAFRGICPECRD